MNNNSKSVKDGSTLTDEELIKTVNSMIEESNLDSITLKSLIHDLQSKFHCDLSDKRQLIKDIVNKFIIQQSQDSISASDDEREHEHEDASTCISNMISKPKSGFNKELQLSTELAEFIGKEFESRSQVVKKIWEYIKKQNLQNPKDKREILCDEVLEKVFKRNKFTMFTMNKFLSSVCYIFSIQLM